MRMPRKTIIQMKDQSMPRFFFWCDVAAGVEGVVATDGSLGR